MFQQAVNALLVTAVAAGPGAANTASSVDITQIVQSQILQFGLLGIFFLCMVFRKFAVPEWTLKNAEERAAAEKEELLRRLAETREQLDKLQDVFQDQMIPALTRATEINARYTDELQKARYGRKDSSEHQ